MHVRHCSVGAAFGNGTTQNSPTERESVFVRFTISRFNFVAIQSEERFLWSLGRKSDLHNTNSPY